MTTLRAWKESGTFRIGEGQGLEENCLLREDGNYVGIVTGTVYPASTHYHSPQLRARIVAVDEANKTGMYHLDGVSGEKEPNARSWKQRYIGCEVHVEEAHRMNDLVVYRCVELGDYWSGNEVQILETEART